MPVTVQRLRPDSTGRERSLPCHTSAVAVPARPRLRSGRENTEPCASGPRVPYLLARVRHVALHCPRGNGRRSVRVIVSLDMRVESARSAPSAAPFARALPVGWRPRRAACAKYRQLACRLKASRRQLPYWAASRPRSDRDRGRAALVAFEPGAHVRRSGKPGRSQHWATSPQDTPRMPPQGRAHAGTTILESRSRRSAHSRRASCARELTPCRPSR